ncbi:MAG TPA: hypothetical protein VN754_04795 [Candidatus Binataceae bacterium]|nr:hypothetical protein [Candidatus Binataceae bacterium]
MKHLGVLWLLLLAGCASSSLSTVDWKPADAAQTTAPPPAGTTKVKQWFTTDTPETLPQDKLDKMNVGGGVGGAY